MTERRIPQWLWGGVIILLVVLLAAVIMLAFTPKDEIHRDSGVFLYGGARLLAGDVLYRDVWDHKPPLVFVLDAAGLLLGGGSPWGVWVLEAIMVSAAAGLGAWLLWQTFGVLPALVGSLYWLAALHVVGGGNYTEEYALLCQFGALALLVYARRSERGGWRWIAAGALGGAALLLKQNVIALWPALAVYLIGRGASRRRWRDALREAGLLVLGGTIVLGVAGLYFALNGALADLWDAVITYNVAYTAAATPADRSLALTHMWNRLGETGLIQIATLSAAGLLLALAVRRSVWGRLKPEARALLIVVLLAAPLEAWLGTLSGRLYDHYFVPWLPLLAVLSAALVAGVDAALGRLSVSRWRVVLVALLFVPLPVLVGGDQVAAIVDDARHAFQYEAWGGPAVVGYIEANTAPDDPVLLWGAETRYNFLSGRSAPSRYSYLYPVVAPDGEAAAAEFLTELQANPPVLIIDTQNRHVPGLDAAEPPAALEPVYTWIRAHYELVGEIDWIYWPVYRLVTGD